MIKKYIFSSLERSLRSFLLRLEILIQPPLVRACVLQPWESQSFCSTYPYEIVCADSWGQSLLAATDTAGVMLLDGEVIPQNPYLPLPFKNKATHPYPFNTRARQNTDTSCWHDDGNDVLWCTFQALIRLCPTLVSVVSLAWGSHAHRLGC